MKRYEVAVSKLEYGTVYVEANSEKEAQKLVYDSPAIQGRINWHGSEWTDIMAEEDSQDEKFRD